MRARIRLKSEQTEPNRVRRLFEFNRKPERIAIEGNRPGEVGNRDDDPAELPDWHGARPI
jgi:hypothetical protein